MYSLSPEQPHDHAAIEALLDAAFEPGRLSRPSYRYRKNCSPVADLCNIAHQNGQIIGAVRYWPVAIGTKASPALLLGPLCVMPEYRKKGVGRALLRHSLARAARTVCGLVVLVGDLAYFEQFGFEPGAPHGLRMEGAADERLLACPLSPGGLADPAGSIQPWNCLRLGLMPAPTRPPHMFTTTPRVDLLPAAA